MDNFYVRHWAHELGHCLGLKHTYIGSVADVGAFEYCGGNQNVRYLADIFGKYVLDGGETGTLDIPRTSGCSLPGAEPDCPIVSMNPQCGTPSADPWDCCINNVMSNNRSARSTTPEQLERMHQMLMISATRNYAWGYDAVPYQFPSFYADFEEPIPFVQEVVLEQPVKFYQDVRVPEGAIVRVKCEVEMVPEARWIIEPGGKLIIDGGVIRAANHAEQRFRGIEVRGYHAPIQAHQDLAGYGLLQYHGIVEFVNGGEVVNADIGVLAGDRDIPNQAGGVIKVLGTPSQTGGIFRNCAIGMEMSPYGLDRQSPINYADFIWEDDALTGQNGEHLIAHAKLRGSHTITFTGCSFINNEADLTESVLMGFGIDAFNSEVRVEPGCPSSGPCTDVTETNSLFLNLDHGVHSTSMGAGDRCWVRKATFTDNICGVYARGHAGGLSVLDSRFDMGGNEVDLNHPSEIFWEQQHRGIFATDCFQFRIRENTVVRSAAGTNSSTSYEGIVVGYSREHNDIVFNNTVSGASSGFVGEGICADLVDVKWQGLQFHCNTNEQNGNNISSRLAESEPAEDQLHHTIRGIQGGFDLAAGNSFDQVATGVDFYMNTYKEPIINPFYDPNVLPEEPVYVTVTPNYWVAPVVVNAGITSTCPVGPAGVDFEIADVTPSLDEAVTQYGNIRYLLDQLIDGGSTDEVVLEITSAWPQDVWDLRSYLLSHSPYLSTDALKQLVNKYGVPDAIKAEVLIANPEATQKEGFLKWAEFDATYPLPSYAIASIRASWEERTYRSHLEAQLASHHAKLTQYTNLLVHRLHNSTSSADPNALLAAWQEVRTPAARYAEAMHLVAQARFVEANNLLMAMPDEKALKPREESERNRMLNLTGTLASAAGQGRNVYTLTTAEISQIVNLRDNGYDRPGNWAGNLLCAVYGNCLPAHSGGDPSKSSAIRSTDRMQAPRALNGGLQVHPNPAQSWVALSYTLPKNEPGELILRDAQGRSQQRYVISGPEGQQVWDCRRVQAGVYTAELWQEGQLIKAEKVVVQP